MNIIQPKQKISSKADCKHIYEVYKMFVQKGGFDRFFGCDFILHDGPPYANGSLHIGHFLNKSLKDFIIRYKIICGEKVSILHGWDCHGLPIENNVVNSNPDYQKKSILEFRKMCADSADSFISVQKNQIQNSFLCVMDKGFYQTKSNLYSRNIIECLFKLNEIGLLYRQFKPNYFSFEEATNISFSEIEYATIKHNYVYLKIDLDGTKNTKLLIYTTQPWTILGNELICISDKVKYFMFDKDELHLIVSESFIKENNIQNYTQVSVAWLKEQTYSIETFGKKNMKIVVDAKYIEEKVGTGILHCAPAHGMEDYEIYMKYTDGKKLVVNCVNQDGSFVDSRFSMYKIHENGNEVILNCMSMNGMVYKTGKLEHRYPISWRSKKPIYVIATEQVMVTINDEIINGIIASAKKVNWYGSEVFATFESTLKSRKHDWCITRQRKWGTPCMLLYDKQKNHIIFNSKFNKDVLDLIVTHGEDVWFNDQIINQLISVHFSQNQHIEKINDTIDVWFDSGSSFMYLDSYLKKNNFGSLASNQILICEGKDQHRGWFQTSAILSYIINGKLSYSSVIVHGFVSTQDKMKISKSNEKTKELSNIIMNETHFEVVRLLFAASSYSKDVICDLSLVEAAKNVYLKVFNTLRYFVNMSDYIDNSISISDVDDVIHCDYINISNNTILNFDCAMDEYNFALAHRQMFEYALTISDFIRCHKLLLYCGDRLSTLYQSTMITLKYMFDKLCYMSYSFMPATVCYVMNIYNGMNNEADIVDYIIANKTQHNKNISKNRKTMEFIKKVYDKLNSVVELARKNNILNTVAEIGIMLPFCYEDSFDILKRFCEVSVVTHDQDYTLKQHAIEVVEIDGKSVHFIHLTKLFAKCNRCWQYNCISGICVTCEKLSKIDS